MRLGVRTPSSSCRPTCISSRRFATTAAALTHCQPSPAASAAAAAPPSCAACNPRRRRALRRWRRCPCACRRLRSPRQGTRPSAPPASREQQQQQPGTHSGARSSNSTHGCIGRCGDYSGRARQVARPTVSPHLDEADAACATGHPMSQVMKSMRRCFPPLTRIPTTTSATITACPLP